MNELGQTLAFVFFCFWIRSNITTDWMSKLPSGAAERLMLLLICVVYSSPPLNVVYQIWWAIYLARLQIL